MHCNKPPARPQNNWRYSQYLRVKENNFQIFPKEGLVTALNQQQAES